MGYLYQILQSENGGIDLTTTDIVKILDTDGLTEVYGILGDETPDVAEEVLDMLADPERLKDNDNLTTFIASVVLLYSELKDRSSTKNHSQYNKIHIKGAGYLLNRLKYLSVHPNISLVIDILLGVQKRADLDKLDKIFKNNIEVAEFYLKAVSGMIYCSSPYKEELKIAKGYIYVGQKFYDIPYCLNSYNLLVKYYNERMLDI